MGDSVPQGPLGFIAFAPVWTFCLLCWRAGVQSTCLCRRIGPSRDGTRAPRQVRCGRRLPNRLPLKPAAPSKDARSFVQPMGSTSVQQFANVTAIRADPQRGLIYLVNSDGLWVLQQHPASNLEVERATRG